MTKIAQKRVFCMVKPHVFDFSRPRWPILPPVSMANMFLHRFYVLYDFWHIFFASFFSARFPLVLGFLFRSLAKPKFRAIFGVPLLRLSVSVAEISADIYFVVPPITAFFRRKPVNPTRAASENKLKI